MAPRWSKPSPIARHQGLCAKSQLTEEYPWLQWRWKIAHLLEKGDVHSQQGDDYPARLYITFAYDPTRLSIFQKLKYEAVKLLYGDYPPLAAINYIWDGRTPAGTIVPNAYTDRVRMIVVESGSARLNQWVTETRNLYEDYRQAFGEEPPPISGVAIMTDTDNTGESATAHYGDIVFKKDPPRGALSPQGQTNGGGASVDRIGRSLSGYGSRLSRNSSYQEASDQYRPSWL